MLLVKKIIILILFIIPFFVKAQQDVSMIYINKPLTTLLQEENIFSLWNEYLEDCNTIVEDTVMQWGTVRFKKVPVKYKGKIVSYEKIPKDTIWESIDNKYKNGDISMSWINSTTISFSNSHSALAQRGDMLIDTNLYDIMESSVRRIKVIKVKKRKAYFIDFFDRWCVEKGYIKTN